MNPQLEFLFEKVFIPLFSAFLGALAAFWFQGRQQNRTDKKSIFATLMSYRHRGILEPDFVRAINLVDVYFGKNEKIKTALHQYLKCAFKQPFIYTDGQRIDAIAELIYQIAKDIGYRHLTRNDILDFGNQITETVQQVGTSNEPSNA